MRSSFYRYKTEFQYTLRKLAVTPLTPPHQLHLATYCGRDKIAKITGGGGSSGGMHFSTGAWKKRFYETEIQSGCVRAVEKHRRNNNNA